MSSGPRLTTAAASSWSDALDLPGDLVADTVITGPAAAAQVRSELGVIKPLRGGSFVLLSTGIAGSATPEPGTDFDAVGSDGDAVTLRLDVHVPPGANRLSFQYNFLSAESPDFIGTIFNDTFSVELVDASGVRPFTVASVNSSEFFPVSSSRAKDSGFNIYSEDPSGVDVEFGAGLPDAGLTDFHSFNAAVTGGADLQLSFTIRDNGDGILDSAVLIDALQFSAIDAIDPNPDLLVAGGAVTSDIEAVVSGGRHVRGVVADGVSEVVLRVQVPGPGAVEFSLPDSSGETDGALTTLAGQVAGRAASSRTVAAGGQQFAVAVYRAPADFNRGGDADLVERTVRIAGRYTPDEGVGFDSQIDLQIKRPPLVVTHGLWSDVFDWLKLPISDDPRFTITYAPYAYACDTELRVAPQPDDPVLSCPLQPTTTEPSILLCGTARSAVAPAIREALENMRRLEIAATRVDVIAHGAAGIRVRKYINTPTYRNVGNLNQGDVNRLITLDTPHLGSEVANALVAGRQNTTGTARDDLLCRARIQARAPIEAGDIDELTTASAALPATPVPSHAVIGTGGKALDRRTAMAKLLSKARLYTDIELKQPVRPFRILGTPSDAFGALDHDLFASVGSQQGGIADAAASTIAIGPTIPDSANADGYSDGDYFHSLRHPPVSDKLVELLNSALAGRFTQFPATGGLRGLSGPPVAARPSSALAATGALRIVSPASGTRVVAGDTITVEVAAEEGFAPETVLIATGGSVSRIDAPPFTTTVRIPREALGPIRLFALGFDARDEIVPSDDVILVARTDATLEVVEIVTQDPVLVGPGARRPLSVLGRYTDGVVRDITSTTTGTVYRTSDPTIVAAAEDGTLTAIAPGIATVVAQNAARQDSVTVTVRANAVPFASAGADASFTCVAPGATVPVRLDGSASSDPDGDPLSFAWSEGGVELATGPTPTVHLGAGVHQIDLTVSDGFSNTAHDTMQVSVVEDREPPVVTISPMRVLFPPDNRYRRFHLSDCAHVVDACQGPLEIDRVGEIVAIHSDEPDDSHHHRGHHEHGHDIVILGTSSFKLRNQSENHGNGRVYEIEFTVHDTPGNASAVQSCFIGVKRHRHDGPPINDGRVFTVVPRPQ